MKKKIVNKFEYFLLEVVLRIARHWGCDIHMATPDKKGDVKWIKLVFPKED